MPSSGFSRSVICTEALTCQFSDERFAPPSEQIPWVMVVLGDGRIEKVISRLKKAKNVRVHDLENLEGGAVALIDADAHVVECDDTWKFFDDFDESVAKFKPTRVDVDNAGRNKHFWSIDGRLVSTGPFSETDAIAAVREMRDMPGRLTQMDEIGTDIQIIYPTIFLRPITKRPNLEVAMCRSYNRWMAERCAEGGSRFSWVVVPPTMIIEEAINEIRFGHENGACGIFWRGFENGRLPTDPYFTPIFEEANRLGMAINLHAANGTFEIHDQFPDDNGIFRFKVPGITAFHNILSSDLATTYPNIRWGFVEFASQWVPYAIHDYMRRGDRRNQGIDPASLMAENNLYVACQTDDDLKYVHSYAGDYNLVAGTDFGHADTSSELLGLVRLKEQGAIAAPALDRILDANARALYAL